MYTSAYAHEVLGRLTLASDGACLTGLWMEGQKYFGSGFADELEYCDDVPVFVQAREWLDRYFAGDRPGPTELPLNPQGTAFQRKVWGVLAQIPYGQLRTYADIAEQLAREDGKQRGSARAVGTANGRNPISIIIPCHRVVGSNGSLTGYAGGIERKLWLLEHEGVDTSKLHVPKRGTAL